MDLTDDHFLDRTLLVKQPKSGFRSGADAVLLAAAIDAKPGQSVLELGMGVGVASLCLAYRVPNLLIAGLEIQETYAALAKDNATANGFDFDVLCGSVNSVPDHLNAKNFDHVFMNPPYYRGGEWTETEEHGKNIALGESADLNDWLDTATKRLKPRGYLTIIQKANRLTDVLRSADSRLGSCEVKPIAPRVGKAAELVIIRFRKGGRADPILHPPLILHLGEKHKQDAAHPTPEAEAIFRSGEKLEF